MRSFGLNSKVVIRVNIGLLILSLNLFVLLVVRNVASFDRKVGWEAPVPARSILVNWESENDSIPADKNTENSVHSSGKLVILGILSGDKNYDRRMAQRETWLGRVPYAEYRFLLDRETPELLQEQRLHNDILFLNSTFTGPKKGLGEKLYLWYRYVNATFPEIPLVAKADDDVYICEGRMKELMRRIEDPRCYAGWSHSVKQWRKDGGIVTEMNRNDEMFVIVGRGILRDILKTPYCHLKRDKNCSKKLHNYDTDFGGTSLGGWISHVSNVSAIALNKDFLHYQNRDYYNNYNIRQQDVCGEFALYHKATPEKMFYLHSRYGKGGQGTATSGKLFTPEKVRSFDFEKLDAILKSTRPKRNHKNKHPCKIYAVVTTIFKSTSAVENVLENLDWCLLVVTDLKSLSKDEYGIPENERYIFLSVDDQMKNFPLFSAKIPWNHFGRKNVGYLYAILAGAKYIWDFDDDNLGTVDLDAVLSGSMFQPCPKTPLVNPYMYFGVNETISWPRGFPLNRIHDESTWNFGVCNSSLSTDKIGVVQSLANNEPDVDGIYRLTRKTPFNFLLDRNPLALHSQSFSPFNGQATMWFEKAFIFMFLPTTVHGRVSDIWRSYIAEHFFAQIDLHLVFTKPYVTQYRNPHEYLGDFDSESDLYHKASGLIAFLQNTEHETPKTLAENALQLYVKLYEISILEEEDILLFAIWLKNLSLL